FDGVVTRSVPRDRSAWRMALVERDERTLHFDHAAAAVDLDPGALQRDLPLRLERQAAVAVDRGVTFHRDLERVGRAVDDDRVAAAVLDRNLARAVAVVERDRVAGAGLNDALLHFAAAHDLPLVAGRRVDTVPQAAEDVRVMDVALLEADEHLVVDLRHELDAPRGAAADADDSRPIARVIRR